MVEEGGPQNPMVSPGRIGGVGAMITSSRQIECHFSYSLINVEHTIIAYCIQKVYSLHNEQQLTNQKLFSAL